MAKAKEGRQNLRRPLRARVEIQMDSGVMVEGQSRDLSLSGVWFSTDRSLPIGNRARVRISLDTELGKIDLITHGHVVRDDEGGLAIEFTDVGAECENNLRRMVGEEPGLVAHAG